MFEEGYQFVSFDVESLFTNVPLNVKDTNSGLYINYNSYEPWHTKTAWIWALYDRAHKTCSNDNLFQKQVARIKKVMSSNGYPRYIRNKILKRLENRKNTNNNYTLEQEILPQFFAEYPMQVYKEKH